MLEKLILYFVHKTKGHITKTQLVKFIYLADLYAVKWTGQQLTELDWQFYHHGPWSQKIDAVLEKRSDIISIQDSGEVQLVKIKSDLLTDETLAMSEGVRLMLDNIRAEWAGSGQEKFKELSGYVYSTAPMMDVKDKHTPEERVPLNLHLEREKLLTELGA